MKTRATRQHVCDCGNLAYRFTSSGWTCAYCEGANRIAEHELTEVIREHRAQDRRVAGIGSDREDYWRDRREYWRAYAARKREQLRAYHTLYRLSHAQATT